ncbi:hypothetical protein ABNG03_08020 [Halorubrum sp. RMP-47]|uniref:Integral membrane protein n=1 Tax=Halorubrum miltondacostae TaxID=3076378 RepID=A0ABD5M4V4_9EURY
MVDNRYDDRLAAADGALLFGGTALLVEADVAADPSGTTLAGGASGFALAGLALATLGVATFSANVILVVRRHSRGTLTRVALWRFAPRPSAEDGDASGSDDTRDARSDGTSDDGAERGRGEDRGEASA